jgi:hypothetical protein
VSFDWQTFWFYSLESLSFLFIPEMCLFTLALLANLVVSVTRSPRLRSGDWPKSCLGLLVNFLFFPAIIFVAVVWAVDGRQWPRPEPDHQAVQKCNTLFFLSLAFGSYWTYRMKGLRWFASAIVLLQQWILLGALFIAGMALSGDWI